jgi:bifunctional lysine-specific demethylase and histidyl-hydroxylase NO66
MTPQVESNSPGTFLFSDLITPLTETAFFSKYWEKQPWVSSRRPVNFFTPLFSIADIDRFICYARPKPGYLDLVTAQGFVTDNYLNPDGTANINLVRDGYLKGSTIVLSGVDQYWEPLRIFCATLEARLHHPTAMAVYLTPPNFQGVKPHYDTQENFLIQVEGTKSWKVYEPIHRLPPVEGSYAPVPREKLSDPILATVLHPGEVLYVPRGFVHEGAAGDQPSLHIAVDVHVRTWVDLISDALKAVAERDPRFRGSLPVSFFDNEASLDGLRTEFDQFLAVLRSSARLEDAVGKHVEALAVRRPPPPDGHFAGLFSEIGPGTRLRRRSSSVHRLFAEGALAGMQFSGNQIVGPAKIAQALRYVAEHDAFTPSALAGVLSEREALVLARRMLRIGLLTVAE